MIPRRQLLALVTLLVLSSVVIAIVPGSAPAWWGVVAVVLVIVLADAWAGFRVNAPQVERDVAGSLSLVTWVDIRLTLQNIRGTRPLTVEVFDHYPDSFAIRGLPCSARIHARHYADLSYRARPMQRGEVRFAGCEMRIASPLGFWWRRKFDTTESVVRVYPNYSTISKLLAFEVDNRLQLAGVRLNRRRGEGIEFHQLRDYREGDMLRSIDWKATARMGRLIAREYQDERDQQIVFMLDAGRRMLAKDGALSHFDHVLNAMLLLSYVALRQGDAAGVMTVSDTRRWLPPRKGADAINGLLNHVYRIQPRPVEIDYVGAATDLVVRQRRRSLIVILTNVREEDSEDLRMATDLLKRRHLVILASLRERALDDTLARSVHSFDDAVLFAATNQYLDARRESQKLLRAGGVFVEDCLSQELPAAITSRYFAIKRAGIL